MIVGVYNIFIYFSSKWRVTLMSNGSFKKLNTIVNEILNETYGSISGGSLTVLNLKHYHLYLSSYLIFVTNICGILDAYVVCWLHWINDSCEYLSRQQIVYHRQIRGVQGWVPPSPLVLQIYFILMRILACLPSLVHMEPMKLVGPHPNIQKPLSAGECGRTCKC